MLFSHVLSSHAIICLPSRTLANLLPPNCAVMGCRKRRGDAELPICWRCLYTEAVSSVFFWCFLLMFSHFPDVCYKGLGNGEWSTEWRDSEGWERQKDLMLGVLEIKKWNSREIILWEDSLRRIDKKERLGVSVLLRQGKEIYGSDFTIDGVIRANIRWKLK